MQEDKRSDNGLTWAIRYAIAEATDKMREALRKEMDFALDKALERNEESNKRLESKVTWIQITMVGLLVMLTGAAIIGAFNLALR